MKFVNIFAGLGSIASAEQLFSKYSDAPEDEYKSSKNRFGNVETNIYNDNENNFLRKEILMAPTGQEFHRDYEQQTNHLKDLTAILKGEKNFSNPKDAPSDLKCFTHN